MSTHEAAAAASAAGHDEHQTSTGLDNTKMAMWAFLGSECLFFGSLISTYLLYRNRTNGGPIPSEIYDIPFTSVSSFVLLMSSLTMVLALAAAQKGDQRGARTWLLATAFLGMTFIGGQIYEFTTFVEEGLALSRSPFGSSFFVLTGFHGAHVLIGTILLAICLLRLMAGQFTPQKHFGFEAAAWYWHFVDVVWLFLFAFVYVAFG